MVCSLRADIGPALLRSRITKEVVLDSGSVRISSRSCRLQVSPQCRKKEKHHPAQQQCGGFWGSGSAVSAAVSVWPALPYQSSSRHVYRKLLSFSSHAFRRGAFNPFFVYAFFLTVVRAQYAMGTEEYQVLTKVNLSTVCLPRGVAWSCARS